MNWLIPVSISEALLVVGIVWRAASLLSTLNGTMSHLSTEVTVLNVTRDTHIELLGRISEKLDAMDRRQDRFDRRQDRFDERLEGRSRSD
jgi:hypothetical protein